MPVPVVEPIPPEVRELRLFVPLLAHEASYFAASARMESFLASSMNGAVRVNIRNSLTVALGYFQLTPSAIFPLR